MKKYSILLFLCLCSLGVYAQTESLVLQGFAVCLPVKNVKNSIDFYQTHLGFSIVRKTIENDNYVAVVLKLGNFQVSFQEEKNMEKENSSIKNAHRGSAVLTFEVKNIENLYNSLKDKVFVLQPLETKFYGESVFSIQDLDGYLLKFSEMKD